MGFPRETDRFHQAAVERDAFCEWGIKQNDGIEDVDFVEDTARFNNNDDGLDLSIPVEVLRRLNLGLVEWRQFTNSQLHIID